MKERPILFSAPMVKALLAGNKSQTRRVVKPQPDFICADGTPSRHTDMKRAQAGGLMAIRCPYGQPGDRLWVRETFGCCDAVLEERGRPIFYKATDYPTVKAGRWRPSIHMPRWASRITLEITGVRVERLQDISTSDAIAEGLKGLSKDGGQITKYGIPDSDGLPGTDDTGWPWHAWRISPVDAYQRLWEQINGPGSWDANPWVWVIEFKRVKP